jgi:quercetin dioxygenase-like cupin family protein
MKMHCIPALLFSLMLALPFTASADGALYGSEVLAKSSQSWDGTPLPVYPSGTPEISIVRITIAPGAALPMHQHPYINAGVLLSGALTVVTELNETKHLKAGDALIEVVNKWHYGRNEGSEPAVILVFYAGVASEPVTRLKP